ncbi:MAG: nucleotidyltransferase family protein [Candidatus Magasanikbacteria bacterium]|nr:nucleotidyltransferase family protein [Candidatus Magasanikbacteria bacterium]
MSKEQISKLIKQSIAEGPYVGYIQRVSLFGSQLHGNTHTASDVDLLVEFAQPVGLFTVAEIEDYFTRKLNLKVDLVTPNSLSKYIRDEVVSEAQCVYEK